MNILFIITSAFIAGSLITLLFIDKKVIKNIRKPKNKVHFYLARDKDGRLWLYLGKPIRVGDIFLTNSYLTPRFLGCDIENYNLDPKDYVNLKWEDEPVEVFINMEE